MMNSAYPLMRYFKFHWEESRGDAYDDWGASWWYFEVADDDMSNAKLQIRVGANKGGQIKGSP